MNTKKDGNKDKLKLLINKLSVTCDEWVNTPEKYNELAMNFDNLEDTKDESKYVHSYDNYESTIKVLDKKLFSANEALATTKAIFEKERIKATNSEKQINSLKKELSLIQKSNKKKEYTNSLRNKLSVIKENVDSVKDLIKLLKNIHLESVKNIQGLLSAFSVFMVTDRRAITNIKVVSDKIKDKVRNKINELTNSMGISIKNVLSKLEDKINNITINKNIKIVENSRKLYNTIVITSTDKYETIKNKLQEALEQFLLSLKSKIEVCNSQIKLMIQKLTKEQSQKIKNLHR